MRKIYVVSYEGDMEIAFESLADAEEYIFYESYLEAMRFLHTASESTIRRRLKMWEQPHLCLMLIKSHHFFIDELVLY
jgi:hypothetical protein